MCYYESLMPKEVQLQYHMFKDKPVDNRTRKQKKLAKQQALPVQTEMFSAREVAPIGLNHKPLIPMPEGTKLQLQIQDPRTPEEIQAAKIKQIQDSTYSYLGDRGVNKKERKAKSEGDERKTWTFPSCTLELITIEIHRDDPVNPVIEAAVKLTSRLNILLWNTPEEELSRLELQHVGMGYRFNQTGEILQIHTSQNAGCFEVRYNNMAMIEDVRWID